MGVYFHGKAKGGEPKGGLGCIPPGTEVEVANPAISWDRLVAAYEATSVEYNDTEKIMYGPTRDLLDRVALSVDHWKQWNKGSHSDVLSPVLAPIADEFDDPHVLTALRSPEEDLKYTNPDPGELDLYLRSMNRHKRRFDPFSMPKIVKPKR